MRRNVHQAPTDVIAARCNRQGGVGVLEMRLSRHGSCSLPSTDKPLARRRWSAGRWIGGGLVLVLALAIILGWNLIAAHREAAKASAAKNPPPEPVTIAEARSGNFPVYLNGLGTVQPYQTVTLHSRVDGQITEVDFRQGQMVKAGDVLVRIDPRPYQAALDQAKAKKSQDEAALAQARADLKRYQSLEKNQFAPVQQVETQQASVEQLVAQIAGDQAQIDSAGTQLDYTTIRAPIAGKTGFRGIDPGNIVHAADTAGIVSIVKLQPISVVLTAPEQQIQAINEALDLGEVHVSALSSDGTQILSQGNLAVVDNAVDQASGTIGMKASFQNGDNALWPGLSVSTRLLLRTLQDVVVVPQDALQRGPDGFYVFVVGADNKVKQQAVKVEAQDDGKAVITQGLKDGDKVVTEGQYKLQQGTAVKAQSANDAAAVGVQQADNQKTP
jgi:membrane fusion protein, multidrug efflux system